MAPGRKSAHNNGIGKKLSQTQETLRDILNREGNYTKVSRGTGISSTRLQEIYRGGRVTSSEAGKIGNYNRRKSGIELSPKDVSDIVGFTEGEIKAKMKVHPKAGYTSDFNKKRVRRSITRLTWDDLTRSHHGGYFVCGHRKNGELAIYYVIILEDVRTGVITVGHGFMDYDVASNSIYVHGDRANTMVRDSSGDPYIIETIIWNIFEFTEDDKEFILRHRRG